MTNPNAEQIVITGAGGWLGTSLLHAVCHGLPDYPGSQAPEGSSVRAFYLDGETPADMSDSGMAVTAVVGDLRNTADCDALLAGTDNAVVYHTAGIIHPNKKVSEFYEINVKAALNMIRAAKEHNARRVVLVSSNSPIGCNPHPEHRFDEDSPYNPYQHYGKSKKIMEESARKLADELGIELVIIRPPWFYGPHQPPRQTLFFTMIKDGGGPLVGNGLNQRSMVYVDNLAHGLLLAGRVPAAAGNTYWIADAEPYEMATILDTIEAVLENDFEFEVKHKRLKLPSIAADVAYYVDAAIQSTGMYHQKIHVLSEMNKNIACSIDKARNELGYEPKVALQEGMKRSIGWCLDQGYTI